MVRLEVPKYKMSKDKGVEYKLALMEQRKQEMQERREKMMERLQERQEQQQGVRQSQGIKM